MTNTHNNILTQQ